MALINLRNALMAGRRLPYDAEVEYLESTGTQWIATGISAARTSSSIKIVATLKFTDVSTGEHDLAGSGNAATPTMGRNGSNYFMWAKGGTSWHPAACDTNWHTVSYTFNQPSGRVFELDGVSYTGSQSNTFATGDGIHIFASGPNRYPLNCQLSKLEIWQNGTLVRDYIPVRKGTVGYLYDRVTRKLFGNAGTGDFVLGPDVVPVEYIESHGTEYIDTGVVPTAADSFYCHIKQNVTKDQALWGLAGVAYCFSNAKSGGSGAYGTYWGHPAIGQGGVNGVNPLGDANWHEILCQPSGIFVDGTQINTQVTAQAQSPLNTVALFARAVNSAGGGVAKNGQGRMSAFRIERNGDPLRKYLSVRVGTEGAMMDVLTRRIYRNAGTGAFTYGNDLKYPIPAE